MAGSRLFLLSNATVNTFPQVGPDADTHTIYYKATAANHNEKTGSFTVTIGQKSIADGTAKDLYYKGYNGYYANDVPFSVGGNLLESGTEYSAQHHILSHSE